MLKENMTMYIEQLTKEHGHAIKLFEEQQRYAEMHHLLPESTTVSTMDSSTRFESAYIERCDKETEELILIEAPSFLKESLTHFDERRHEFMLLESTILRFIGVDALSIEIDDVFETYTALFGLKMKKNRAEAITNYLNTHLQQEVGNFSIAFSDKDGLWDINFALNYIDGYTESLTIGDAAELAYQFIFNLVETVEETV